VYIVEAVGVDANTDMSGPIGDKCSISGANDVIQPQSRVS